MQRTHITSLDGSSIPVTIRQSPRAKRISISVSHTGNEVALVYPKRVSLKRAMEFLHSKTGWISQQCFSQPAPIPFVPGNNIPVLGEILTLHNIPATRGETTMEDGQLTITCLPEFFSRRVWDYLKKMLSDEIKKLASEKAEILDVKPGRITLRDTSTRWGSCSSSGNLSFSTRLVFTPREVMDYLVCHELAHLKEMNHSRTFWRHVATLCPDYKTHETWLKKHGRGLHRYG